MNFCSCFYEGNGYFGGYPNADHFQELIQEGITVFVDLTTLREQGRLPFVYKVPPDTRYLHFPILDNQIPINRQAFLRLVYDVASLLKQGKKVYVHCKGGHGRSGVLVSSLLCYMHNITPDKALRMTTVYHSQRPNLKAKWKHSRCPQEWRQQKFVMDLFEPVAVTYNEYHQYETFLHRYGLRPVVMKGKKHSYPEFLHDFLHYIRDVIHYQRHKEKKK